MQSAREVASRALAAHSQQQQYDAMHDSSDDEIPVPMKLSALTKALLNDGGASDPAAAAAAAAAAQPHHQPEPRIMTRRRSYLARSNSSAVEEADPAPEPERPVRETRRHVRTNSAAGTASSRPVSPARPRDSSPPPRKRVVRLSNTPADGPVQAGRLRRSLSTTSTTRKPESRASRDHAEVQNANAPAQVDEPNVNTPAQSVRRVQIAIGSSAQRSSSQKRHSAGNSSGIASRSSGSAMGDDHEVLEEPQTAPRPQSAMGSVSRFGGSVMAREEQSVQGSMRVKRLGKIPGSFLSGPARRGRRRESEEDRLMRDNGEGDMLSSQERDGPQPYHLGQGDAELPASSYYEPAHRDFAASGSPVNNRESRSSSRRRSHADLRAASLREAQKVIEAAHQEDARAPPEMPSARDQENGMPAPSAFQRRRPSVNIFSDKDPDKNPPRSPSLVEVGSRALHRAYSPERPILATISQNVQKTPHVVIPMLRPAPPPPPKMSVLEAATATAGAATTKEAAKKRSIILKVNGRSYQRVDCIGRGGSAKVYRVTAENGKMFALKRVNIENADENTVRGFKGEINLLQKLSTVERVIQLYDFELNEEKHVLSLVS